MMERLAANIRLPKHPQSDFPRVAGTFWKRPSAFRTLWEARKVLENKIVNLLAALTFKLTVIANLVSLLVGLVVDLSFLAVWI